MEIEVVQSSEIAQSREHLREKDVVEPEVIPGLDIFHLRVKTVDQVLEFIGVGLDLRNAIFSEGVHKLVKICAFFILQLTSHVQKCDW